MKTDSASLSNFTTKQFNFFLLKYDFCAWTKLSELS